jgi:glutaminyl-tRNA synthetase
VRLRYSYLVTCKGAVKNDRGEVVEVHCDFHPDSVHSDAANHPRAKATLHWVSAAHALRLQVRLYDRLFAVEDPTDERDGRTWGSYLNPHSLDVLEECYGESALGQARPGDRFQFERLGYFCADPDSVPGRPVFNRTVTLRDTWARIRNATP